MISQVDVLSHPEPSQIMWSIVGHIITICLFVGVVYHLDIWSIHEATLKKSLFPFQRVAKIMASRAAAKSFFFRFIFFLLQIMKFLPPPIYFFCKIMNKSSHSAVICSPGRWTGNNFFLRVARGFCLYHGAAKEKGNRSPWKYPGEC